MTHGPGYLAHQLANVIDARDWDGLASLLAPDCTVRYVHDGSRFTGPEWVAFNAEYPGQWSFVAEGIVAAETRAVLRARVFNENAIFHVAAFLTAADGLINEIVEVWADGHSAPTQE